MSTPLRCGWIAALALAAVNVFAEDGDDLPIAPDELVYCTVCHGVQLMGNQTLDAPRLSGMDAWYVAQALKSFRMGWRGTHPEDLTGMEMRPMAAALSDEQVGMAAKFVNATRSPLPPATIEGDSEAGREHYASCAACHGVNAEGNRALGSPALTGLNDWYLTRQLEKFKNGVRGSDPADTYGQQMRAATGLLGDDQAIQDVVKYITTLPNGGSKE